MLTGISPGGSCSMLDSFSYFSGKNDDVLPIFLGDVRSVIWFAEGEYIITFRHFFVKNNYVILVNSDASIDF